MVDVLRRMPAEDWRLLEGLLVALRGASGGGGVSVKMVPGVGLVISGAPGRRNEAFGAGRRVLVRLTAAGSATGLYEAEEVWWESSPDSGEAAWEAVPGGYVWAAEDPDDGRTWMGELRELSDLPGLQGDVDLPREAWLEAYADGEAEWVFDALKPVLAKLTGDGASDGFYEAEQVDVDGSGEPVTVAGGLTFNAANAGELQETNKTAGIAMDSVFEVTRRVTTGGEIRWVFTAGGSALPPPGLENHVLQLNENLEPFWGTVRIAAS